MSEYSILVFVDKESHLPFGAAIKSLYMYRDLPEDEGMFYHEGYHMRAVDFIGRVPDEYIALDGSLHTVETGREEEYLEYLDGVDPRTWVVELRYSSNEKR